MASQKRPTRQSGSSRKKARAPEDRATAYARDVVEGRIVAGPHVRNACRRHLQDLEQGPSRGLTWNTPLPGEKEAPLDRVFGFFREVLRLNGGQYEGLPFELQPSQAFIVGSLFGWRRADGTRRFRRGYIEQGKGGGKSPLIAGIGMYGLMADGEPRAEIYAGASKKDQAMVLFRDAVAMYGQSPRLATRLTASGANPVWQLTDLASMSFYKPISNDDGKSGYRPHFALCDEVHEHPDRDTIDMLERGFKSRRQPLLLMITNSGSDRNTVCWEEHVHAVRVAAGSMTADQDPSYVGEAIDDETFSYVCALDPDDDPLEDPSCWIKANPLLGITVKQDYLASVARQAKLIPGKANGIRRLHFCEWTDADQAWLVRSTIEKVLKRFDPLEHAGKRMFVALDLSGTQDLTAKACVVETGTKEVQREKCRMENGRRIGTGEYETLQLPTYAAWVEAWTPKDTLLERAAKDQAPYEVWVKGGWLNAVEGKVIRLDYVAARVAEDATVYQLELLAYDRYAYRRFEDELSQFGLTIEQIEHPQGGRVRGKPPESWVQAAKDNGQPAPLGLWMPGSVEMLETLILEERIDIQHSPLIISAMASAAIEHDPFNNRWFSKRKATNRIDALVALAMAVGAATAAPPAPGLAYEGRDLLVL